MFSQHKLFAAAICICQFAVQQIHSTRTEEDLTISFEQKLLLEEFQEFMIPRLSQEYMRNEIFLIPWLRATGFDVPAAEKKLNKHLRWRRENKIDTIFEEDWSYFDNNYRVNVEGCDDEGRPIISMFVGEWNFRRAVLSGNGPRLSRYLEKMMEELVLMLRIMQDNGNVITRINLVLDLNGFSLTEQVCPRCISIIVNFLFLLNQNYPEVLNTILSLNNPQMAIRFWENILKPAAPKEIQELLYIYGRNNRDWFGDFEKHGISRNNLSPELGGTGCDPLDMGLLRLQGRNYTCPDCRD